MQICPQFSFLGYYAHGYLQKKKNPKQYTLKINQSVFLELGNWKGEFNKFISGLSIANPFKHKKMIANLVVCLEDFS